MTEKSEVEKCLLEHTKLVTRVITCSKDLTDVYHKYKNEKRIVGAERNWEMCKTLESDLYEKIVAILGELRKSEEMLEKCVMDNYLVKRAVGLRKKNLVWMITRVSEGRSRLQDISKVNSFIELIVRLRGELIGLISYHQSILKNAFEKPSAPYGWY
jgi:hypothetical protein